MANVNTQVLWHVRLGSDRAVGQPSRRLIGIGSDPLPSYIPTGIRQRLKDHTEGQVVELTNTDGSPYVELLWQTHLIDGEAWPAEVMRTRTGNCIGCHEAFVAKLRRPGFLWLPSGIILLRACVPACLRCAHACVCPRVRASMHPFVRMHDDASAPVLHA